MRRHLLMAGQALVSLCVATSLCAQSLTAISLATSSFNAKVIADGTGSNPQTVTTTAFDGTANNIFYTKTFQAANSGTITAGGLPNSGAITNGIHNYQLQPYGNTSQIMFFAAQTSTSTKSLTLTTAATYAEISLLATAGNGPASISFTLHFSDGTNSTTYGPYSVGDWFGGTTYVINNLGRISRNTTVSAQTGTSSSDPRLYHYDVALNAGDNTKLIQRVDITDNSTNNSATAGIFALSGSATVLPLGVNSLQGQYDPAQKGVVLQWQAPETFAGEFFQIQRSTDGNVFDNLATIDLQVNQLSGTFDYTDLTASSDVHFYYRIKDVQAGGNTTYSNIVAISAGEIESVHAWCSGGELRIAGLNNHLYAYQLLNVNGQYLQEGSVGPSEPFSINISYLTTGVYILHLRYLQNNKTIKFLKP